MIQPDTHALFQKFDRLIKGYTLKAQIEACSLIVYQAIVTAARASGIPRPEVIQGTMSAIGEFIATCEILERSGESEEQEAATDAANDLIYRYTRPAAAAPAPACASTRGLECDCPGVICRAGSR